MLGGTVRGTRTTLRLPTEADLASHGRWAADPRVRRAGRVGYWAEPAMAVTWKERFTEQAKDKRSVLWSIDADDGTLVGAARLGFDGSPPADAVEITLFLIDPDRAGKGYGWDAALALHRWVFDFMHLRQAAVEHVPAEGAAAIRILEKLGHRRFAHGHAVAYRDGAFVDEYHYQMELDGWDERWGAEREYAPLGPESEA